MSSSTSGVAAQLRRVPTLAYLGGLALLAVVTVALALVQAWAWTVVGLVLLQLLAVATLLVVLPRRVAAAVGRSGPGAGGRGAGSVPSTPTTKADAGLGSRLDDLSERLDALSARTVAGQERTRVELLDALQQRPADRA